MSKSQYFHSQVSKALEDLIRAQNNTDLNEFLEQNPIKKSLSHPPEFKFGQLAYPCFPFARFLRQAPPKIALKWAQEISLEKTSLIQKVEAVNGYLNFHCHVENFFQELYPEIHSGKFFNEQFLRHTEKINVEYSQPNTHKALHIGHLRNLVYGDAVCNLQDHIGNSCVRSTYPGDLGTHIAKSLWYIESQKKEAPPKQQAQWLGEMYAQASEHLKKIEGSSSEDQTKEQIGEILQSLQAQEGPIYQLYLKTRDWSLEQMRTTYQWLGSHFDVWYYESECDEASRALVKQKFQEGFFVESEKAIGIDLSDHDLGFALFLKGDGNGLYLTKDLELIKRKFSDPEIKRALYIVDSRQKLHFQQLFKTAELMGLKQAKNSLHLAYESVTDAHGKAFSSRALSGVSLDDLRKNLEEKVLKNYLEKNRGLWSDQEILECSQNIVIAALKYGMLRVDPGSMIKFIEEQWLSLEGDTGPYLLYVYSRCNSLLEKAHQKTNFNLAQLSIHPENEIESELLFEISKFNKIVFEAATQYRPNVLTQYLFSLCKLFNRFYRESSVLNAPEKHFKSRVAIVSATQKTLAKGLQLLGIPTIQRM